MPAVREQIEANDAKRRRAFRVAIEVVGWVALTAVVIVAGWALMMRAHFECGGTLGGFGEAPDARLDRSCYDDAISNVHLVWLIIPAAIVLRLCATARPSARGAGR